MRHAYSNGLGRQHLQCHDSVAESFGASEDMNAVAFAVTQIVTFDDRAGQDQALNGQYPSGVIDWGTGAWYHSGPWGAFTTKSASFSASGVTSRT